MQAYKVKGKIDPTGHLIIAEAIDLAPGDVEVIVLQSLQTMTERKNVDQPNIEVTTPDPTSTSIRQVQCEIPRLKQWLEQSPPVAPDFDPEQAKWDYLKEKHKL